MDKDKSDYSEHEEYWRSNHAAQPYAQKDYDYEHYAPAYRTGTEGYGKYAGRSYDEAEDDLARDYEVNVAEGGLPWDHARHAVRAAWAKVSGDVTGMDRDRGIRSGF